MVLDFLEHTCVCISFFSLKDLLRCQMTGAIILYFFKEFQNNLQILPFLSKLMKVHDGCSHDFGIMFRLLHN